MSTELEHRLATLEGRVRLWRILSVAAVALAVASFAPLLGGYTTRVVHAHAFSLMNDRGEEVARLGDNGEGEPVLRLKIARNGASVLVGALGEDVAGFAMIGNHGVPVSLWTDKSGAPSLGLTQDGRHKVTLAVPHDGLPTLLMIDEKANLAATASYILLKDPSDKIVFSTRRDAPADAGEREPR
jgi:hypothetical protein